MFYLLLKWIVRFSLRVFYKQFEIIGKEELLHQGPLIVAANHPNTLMDPIIIASILKGRPGFLAKSTLFINPIVNIILKSLKMIPVYRAGEGKGNAEGNKKAFEKCYQYLDKKGILLIFPEGNSYHEMRLRPLKTGASRIALEYMEQNNFKGDIKILPISLNYSNPGGFREKVQIVVGKAIDIKNYNEAYQKDARETVTQLTDDIRKGIEQGLYGTIEPGQEPLYQKIKLMFKDAVIQEFYKNNLTVSTLEVNQKISDALLFTEQNNPALYQKIDQSMQDYFGQLKQLKIDERHSRSGFRDWTILEKVSIPLYLLAGLPIFFSGLLFNYLPYRLPSLLFPIITKELEYKAAVQMILGMLLFPMYYSLLIVGINQYLSLDIIGNSAALVYFIFSGYYSLHYDQVRNYFYHAYFLHRFKLKNEKLYNELILKYEHLLGLLHEGMEGYLRK